MAVGLPARGDFAPQPPAPLRCGGLRPRGRRTDWLVSCSKSPWCVAPAACLRSAPSGGRRTV